MPILKSAIKKQRIDKKRAAVNVPVRARVKTSVKAAGIAPSKALVQKAYSAVDRAVKGNLISKNKASRIKSRLVAQIKTKLKISPFTK